MYHMITWCCIVGGGALAVGILGGSGLCSGDAVWRGVTCLL